MKSGLEGAYFVNRSSKVSSITPEVLADYANSESIGSNWIIYDNYSTRPLRFRFNSVGVYYWLTEIHAS